MLEGVEESTMVQWCKPFPPYLLFCPSLPGMQLWIFGLYALIYRNIILIICIHTRTLIMHFHKISYGTTSASLSNTTIYQNYFRANPPSTTLTPALLALMNEFQWKRVGFLTQDENRFRRVSQHAKKYLSCACQ